MAAEQRRGDCSVWVRSADHGVWLGQCMACYEFDLSRPIWLDANVNEFKQNAKTRFRQESFVETIEFDFLEMHVIEED